MNPPATSSKRTIVVLFAVAALYSWWASGLRSFTHPAALAVGVPGVVVMTMLGWSRRRPTVRAERALGRAGIVLWAAVLAVIVGWELVQYVSSPRSAHPTLSSMADRVLETHPARAAAFFGWLVVGRTILR